ncbi:MAG: hypothetical protein WCL61_03480, partial [bacterium]
MKKKSAAKKVIKKIVKKNNRPAKQAPSIKMVAKTPLTVNKETVPVEAVGHQYVSINETSSETTKKNRIITFFVVAAAILLVIGFFFSLKNNLNKITFSFNQSDIINQLGDGFKEMQNTLNTQQEKLNEAVVQISSSSMENIKKEILARVAASLSTSTWPYFTSDITKVNLQYPTDWQKNDNGSTLTISKNDPNSSSTIVTINITQKTNPKATPLKSWLSTTTYT